ncbi:MULTISPECIES: DEAD/DEAH box helicase [unclassified Cryobacterium]|uniref:DEAD/DEAH box helicase n=1 Tax=unclassified Cryobacterium TaxID=2649013 RepID=UPI001069DBDE|nr:MULTISPECIES: DEAD/DEAH box helicase [unclassified Cryobacterium]TFB98892.1 DEAD/DEAH box helicase [Cryobacterium sp. MDB2-A-1]TFC09078.1 DEAD/DEAH box helicase [Cryobacterium sp. MDB2-33-2]TFC14858.1 DEAD/DEAH box helicase [Cryobacterium sp. MDB2-A-2]TFC16490.1 DEAD/DEAH box helicase [Cryobacterium sp. MDB2-10]
MPTSNNPAVSRSNKNFDPKYAAKGGPSRGGSNNGSKSPGHRGYQADAGAPKKARWNAGERADRAAGRPTNDRPAYGDRPARSNDRPAYGDRPARGNDRPSYNNDRPSYNGASRTDRPTHSNTDRPTYNARSERPSYNSDRPRTDRPSYNSDRPSYGDRAPRTDRPAYNKDRPSYGDRPARTDRPSYNNDRPRTDRPTYNNDRPSYGDRPARTDRPAYNNDRPRTDRPAYNNDRPSYGDRAARTERPSYGDRPARTERPSYGDRPERSHSDRPSYGDRPARTERPSYGDRPDRAARTERSDRPSYGDRPDRSHSDRSNRSAHDDGGHSSNFYPSRDTKAHFAAGDDVVLERLEAIATTAAEVVGVTFGDLGLGENIVRELGALGAASPFPIQAATIPDVLAGRDVLGRGKTGSGKTIAFGAPLVEKLMENNGAKDRKMARKPRALILAPTRELALQIDRTVQPIARSVGLFTTQIYGGVPQYRQVSALQRGVDIIIGTAGRIEDLIEQGRLDLSEVVVTVLDEADYMCDLGFLEPVQRILRQTKKGGQKLLFSATLDKGVASLVKEFLTNPAVHEVAGEDQASSTIDHKVLVIEHRDKSAIIGQLVDRQGKTLIFSRTRAYAEQLAEQLEDAGVKATSLHGDLNQARRTRNLQMLTSGRVNVLVATDVAARGIHVDDIDLVIQADAPDEYKTYLHRSGRTGRAGKSGTVVTLIPKQRRRRMDELLERADIEASFMNAAPGDAAVRELAGL